MLWSKAGRERAFGIHIRRGLPEKISVVITLVL